MSDTAETVPVPKTEEQLTADRVVTAFVERYAKVRNPGVTLQFLKQFLQNTAADKIMQDATSTFAALTVERLSQIIYATGEAEQKLAEENIRKRDEALAQQKAAEDAAKAEAAAAKAAEPKKGKKKQ